MRQSALFGLLLVVLCRSRSFAAQHEPPTDWIDPATGHHVVQLSREPGSASFYFHQNAYSSDGTELVIATPGGLSAINLGSRTIDEVVPGKVRPLVAGRKTGDIYYLRDDAVWTAKLDSHQARKVADLPPRFESSNVTVNADETLIVGLAVDPTGVAEPRHPPAGYATDRLTARWASGAPMVIYTIDVETRKQNFIYRSNDWLNHLQCSPTDPRQILFCNEGPWHLVDRTWLICVDGSNLTQVHHRSQDMEIAGHEFFSGDGKTVWYDLQTPRSAQFWLAGYDLESGARTWYQLERNEWSVHYNVSPDGTLFAGDGGGPESVANQSPAGRPLDPPGNGQWIYLFRPELSATITGPKPSDPSVKTGILRADRLVDLSQHNYALEPNVTFTPDGKWVVFRSNFRGPTQVYAVEISPAEKKTWSAGAIEFDSE